MRMMMYQKVDILNGDCEPQDLLGGGLKDENDDAEEEIPLDDVVLVEHVTRSWLENQLVCVRELDGGGIKIEVVDFLQRNTQTGKPVQRGILSGQE